MAINNLNSSTVKSFCQACNFAFSVKKHTVGAMIFKAVAVLFLLQYGNLSGFPGHLPK